jgi:Holliday junction resolvase RusA-like endonuclease
VELVADFYVRRPKGLPKRWVHAIKKPDLDKLLRAIGDGLTGVVWRDDSQVISISATKHYGLDPRVEVTIIPVGERTNVR